MKRNKSTWLGCAVTVFLALALPGCAKPGGGGGGATGATQVVIPLGGLVGEVELKAGEPVTFRDTFEYPAALGPFDSIAIDMAATLESVTVTPTGANTDKGGVAQQKTQTTQTTYRIAPADEIDTVCETGVAYGPFVVTGNQDFQPVGVEPETATLTEASLTVINSGEFAVCVEVVSRADATMNIGGLAVDLTPAGASGTADECEEGAAADFTGTWIADWECTDSCSGAISGTEALVITQTGDSASYIDAEGLTISGTICGNEFSWQGADGAYGESGVWTMTADGVATKVSEYQSTGAPFCSGNCTGTMTRQSGSAPDGGSGDCAEFGEACTSNSDCCGGMPCIDGGCI